MALDARNIKIKEADFVATCERVTKRMFAGKEFIEYNDVLQLRHQMSQALWHFEYHQYFEEMENKDNKQISAQDFAKSILIFMPFNKF